jgi:hypothetical protein
MVDFCLFIALCATRNKFIYGADVTNAFSEAKRCDQIFYMHIDDVYRDWWHSKGQPPIPDGYVLPVLKNLQGHPEAPRQWALHVNALLKEFGLQPTTHAPCIYHGTVFDDHILFLRLTDDFAIGCSSIDTFNGICSWFNERLLEPLKQLGLLTYYNGINIQQTQHFIKIDCSTYITKCLESHGWQSIHPVSLPMDPSPTAIRAIDEASAQPDNDFETRRFRYRGAIGEIIWMMVTCRPDIAFPCIKLSQFSVGPAPIHYDAVERVFKYLAGTINHGLVYWRTSALSSLPDVAFPTLLAVPDDPCHTPSIPVDHTYGYVDSDWAADSNHRRSITGMLFLYAGAAVAWRSRVQPSVSTSSTEAEFIAASDAGKLALYIRSILDDLQIPQKHATLIFEDNRGAYLMAHAGRPTKQSRHIDIRHFALQDWIERDLINLTEITTTLNAADVLTKPVTRVFFHRHCDLIFGNHPPSYVTTFQSKNSATFVCSRPSQTSSRGGC